MVAEAAPHKADLPSRAMTVHKRHGGKRNAVNAVNAVNVVNVVAVENAANAAGARPGPANKLSLYQNPVGQALGQRGFFVW